MVEGHVHAILLGKMQNRPGTIQIIVAIWSKNLADYFTKIHAHVHHKNTRPIYVINSLASQGCNKGVLIVTNIPYVHFVLTTSNMT